GTPCSTAAASRTRDAVRATSTTRAPARARRSATPSPIPLVAPVTTAIRPLSSGDDAMDRDQPQELLARPQILQEHTLHRARDRLRVLLLHTPHHHAQVIRLADHTHALRL